MALCNKLIGDVVKQNRHVFMASMLNCSVRSMSTRSTKSTNLFVGGLCQGIDDQCLKEAFDCFGEVTYARVIADRDNGRSRGFGFVVFSSQDSADSAMSAMDGQKINGRQLCVRYGNRPGYRPFHGSGEKSGSRQEK